MIDTVSSAVTQTRLAVPLRLDASAIRAAESSPLFRFGGTTNPRGGEISVDRVSLVRDGKRWLATMGEFHYARYPREEWRDELLKIKAGGIEILATYVFWIHHEEVKGEFRFDGERDLRAFVELCGEVDLPIVLRIGPWAHGEARNGGLPEWLVEQQHSMRLRSDDPAYLNHVKTFFAEIGQHVAGLLWKDDGPIVGVQIENEYGGEPEHLLTLKSITIEAGLDVPLYTRTGWPDLAAPMPRGELLPLYGGYAEGFWDRELTPMPGNYWREYRFSHHRNTATVATDHFGTRDARDDADADHYPYFTCETGGGMMSSYHRRITVDPLDVYSIALIKLGSGSNLPGYYMYHGGVNPRSRTGITLNEHQATRFTNYNDLPTRAYDFQAPLGEAGQVRPHYHLLRRLHLFLKDFGESLATMTSILPDTLPKGREDRDTLRWAIRTNGRSGFLFVSNHQRGATMPVHEDVQFSIALADGQTLTLPSRPISIPTSAVFMMPMGLALEEDLILGWATAQPVCRHEFDGVTFSFFAEIPGITCEFCFEGEHRLETDGRVEFEKGRTIIGNVSSGLGRAITLRMRSGRVHAIVLLSEEASLSLYKCRCGGGDVLALSNAAVTPDGDALQLQNVAGDRTWLKLFRPKKRSQTDSGVHGAFEQVELDAAVSRATPVAFELVREPGPARSISLGNAGVAEQPSEADFATAAVYRISLPTDLDLSQTLLRVNYVGDVARFYAGDILLTDDFYSGKPFELALWRYANEIRQFGLQLKVLPLRQDAAIYLAPESWPAFVAGEIAQQSLRSVEVITRSEMSVRIRPAESGAQQC